MRTFPALLIALALAACGHAPEPAETEVAVPPPPAPTVRFASYNASLYSDEAGGLIARLEAGDEAARSIAAVIQHQRPDVLLLNEFDHDATGRAADLFQRDYLGQPQHGQTPIVYEHRYFAPVNTGVASGLDLNRDGKVDGGEDAWGFGNHPGQYGMLVLSRYPIDQAAARTFQTFLRKDLPEPTVPRDPATGEPWYPQEVWQQLRLSSKSHWDVPIKTPLGTVHLLASHPTPPVYDGPEDRNGARNRDEIRFWIEYVAPTGGHDWIVDDAGRRGGLPAEASFVIAGDLNADPKDGDSTGNPAALLLAAPRVNGDFVPTSEGAVARAVGYDLPRQGDPAAHTGDFGPRTGTLRIDYVLPSRDLDVANGGVFWPLPDDPMHAWTAVTDHHMVWLDLTRESTASPE